jgi:hypothetical protein
MAALPRPDDDLNPKYPDPLEFFQTDFIHPDNQAVIEHEEQRWRLLGFWERIRLQRRVDSLARELRKGKYNQIVEERHKLGRAFRKAKREYQATTFISREAKGQALAHLRKLWERGNQLKREYSDLRPTYEAFHHYAGWLEYERDHRQDLKDEKKRDAKILRDMKKESKWIEGLVRDVFKRTSGCHYIKHDDGKKDKNIAPKFERVIIKPDAHHLYLSISKKVLWSWKATMPQGVTPDRLQDEEVVNHLKAALKRQCRWVWSESGQLILEVSRLDSPDSLPKHVRWRDAMKFYPKDRHDRLPYCVGITENRKFLWFDFESDANLLVAGKQGSGKSNLVNGIIATLVTTHTPEELRLVLIDQKGGIEFTHWEEVPHLLWDMIKTLDGVEPVLKRLVRVMQKRMALLEKAKAKKISEYNARVDVEDRLERIILVIDELNTFVGLGRQTEEIHNLLMLLTSQGRACGLHLIAATQYPEVKVLPGRIKANMSVRCCGFMPSVISSQVVLDSPEAARIPNIAGRMAGTSGLHDFIVQVAHIMDEEIGGAVTSLKRLYTSVKNDLNGMQGGTKLKTWDEQAFLKASIEWTDKKLRYVGLHKMLGNETPGERALNKLQRSLLDEYKAEGVLTLQEDGTQWRIKRVGKAYHLVEQGADGSDGTAAVDETSAHEKVEPVSVTVSGSPALTGAEAAD